MSAYPIDELSHRVAAELALNFCGDGHSHHLLGDDTGGGNGTTHLLCSVRPDMTQSINYTTPEDASGYYHVNLRMSAFGSGHEGGANFVMADCSARFIPEEVDDITLQAMATRSAGELLQNAL